MKTRIAKFIAESGIASRRGAEELIASGHVSVNGEIINTPVVFVDDNDTVLVNGNKITKKTTTELYAFHKPINTMTTRSDPSGRKTIYDYIPDEYKHLKYIGRLDYKTTGLLLLTNDGELARKMTLPSSKIPRTYIATVYGDLSKLDMARRGIIVRGVKYAPMQIDVIDNKNLRVTVVEGKKNEIRIVLAAIGAPVKKLHRISFGSIKLENLESGKIKKIKQKTIDVIAKSF
ncbi:MAG: rRNA pseudouridine synthase [Alphaproteobacteria bacterium]|nr:rRNA pseudouridine synthase [Alphaproteobacteria bacterium]